MKMHNFSTLYQKLVYNIALNFFGNQEEAQIIVQETYLKWVAHNNIAFDATEMSLIRIAANLCMEKGIKQN
jgi:DNA-directed RNA polymerase specialized sigma24 family protein